MSVVLINSASQGLPLQDFITVAQWINWGGGEKGKGKSKAKDKGGGKSKDDGGSVASATMGEEPQGKSGAKTGGGGQEKDEEKLGVRASMVESSTSQQPQGEAAEGLRTEVTSLLKSLRMNPPQLRAYQERKVGRGEPQRILLDGGATHCLRVAKDDREWREGVPVSVQLASGNVDMRINTTTKTLLVPAGGDPIQQIIPLNKLTDIGYEIQWTKAGCSVRHGVHGVLDFQMEQGCPTVNNLLGMELMQEIEKLEASRVALRKVALGQCCADIGATVHSGVEDAVS